MPKNTTENARTRNWSFIMYPDSAPTNWKEILEDTHVNIVISPLHDKDINPGTEEYKKAHWHCLIMFDSVKTVKQAKEISDLVKGTNPILVQSLNGMVRYLIHKDNPEKAQYKREDIINIGFFEVDDAFKNSCDKYLAIKDMINFIKENQVVEYIDFMEFCANNRFDDWFKLLCDSCSFVIQGVITSNRNKLKDLYNYGNYELDDNEQN